MQKKSIYVKRSRWCRGEKKLPRWLKWLITKFFLTLVFRSLKCTRAHARVYVSPLKCIMNIRPIMSDNNGVVSERASVKYPVARDKNNHRLGWKSWFIIWQERERETEWAVHLSYNHGILVAVFRCYNFTRCSSAKIMRKNYLWIILMHAHEMERKQS